MTLGNDDLEELTGEIRRLIESNKAFLERVSDEEYDDPDEEDDDPDEEDEPADGAPEAAADDYEEL